MLPPRLIPQAKDEISDWIDQWQFSRFVTLTFNDNSASDARLPGSKLKYGYLRDRLKDWDARINHVLIGRDWADRYPYHPTPLTD